MCVGRQKSITYVRQVTVVFLSSRQTGAKAQALFGSVEKNI